jgi:hypothetical protein
MLILAKNPTKGGIPAIEKIVSDKENDKAGFDFFNKDNSLNSLLYLFVKFCFFNLSNKIIYQIDKLEII